MYQYELGKVMDNPYPFVLSAERRFAMNVGKLAKSAGLPERSGVVGYSLRGS